MRVSRISKLFFACSLLLALAVSAFASVSFEEAAKLLPDKVGAADAQTKATPPTYGIFEHIKAENFGPISTAMRGYISTSGEKFGAQIVHLSSDANAYALLTEVRRTLPPEKKALDGVGTAAFLSPGFLAFYKGTTFVTVSGSATDNTTLVNF